MGLVLALIFQRLVSKTTLCCTQILASDFAMASGHGLATPKLCHNYVGYVGSVRWHSVSVVGLCQALSGSVSNCRCLCGADQGPSPPKDFREIPNVWGIS
eukprot:4299018-Prymnesium_polylepis.2